MKEHQERLAKMLSKRDEQMRSLGVVPWLSGSCTAVASCSSRACSCSILPQFSQMCCSILAGRPIEISGPLVKLMLARWRGWAHQVSGDRRQLVNPVFLSGVEGCCARRERITNSLLKPSYSLNG